MSLFIFDMGGVVSGNVSIIPDMAARLGLTCAEFYALCGVPEDERPESRYDHGLLADIQSGRSNSTIFWNGFRQNAEKTLGANHPGRNLVETVTRGENLWETCFAPTPIESTIALIAALRKNGYRVVCGTNTLDVHYAIHRRNGDYKIFDAVYASHFLGVIKPHHEFWDRIRAAEGAKKEDILFIDDNSPNVEAARAAGVPSVQYTGPESLEIALEPWLAQEASRKSGR